MMRAYDRIGASLGFGPDSDFNIEDLCQRATLYRQLTQIIYKRGGFTADDLDEARVGLSHTAVGKALVALNDEASRGASTWPAGPPEGD